MPIAIVDDKTRLKSILAEARAIRRRLATGVPENRTKAQVKLADLVERYLIDQPGQKSDAPTIAEALLGKGHDLGVYPTRTVANCLCSVRNGVTWKADKKEDETGKRITVVRLLKHRTAAYNPAPKYGKRGLQQGSVAR